MPTTATRMILRDDGPIHIGVKRTLCARIGKQWKVNDRLPSISDLARELGVGQNSAHRAVRELVSEGVLFSRRRLGVYVRALPPRGHDVTDTTEHVLSGRTIALAYTGEAPRPFVQRMIDGFREVIVEVGADTVMTPMEPRHETYPETAGAWGTVLFNPDSSIVVGPGKRNVVVVSTADHLHPDLLSRFDSVGVDQYQGGALAGRTLREAGCRRICFLGKRVAVNLHRFDLTSTARLCGFERGWGEPLADDALLYAPGYSIHAGARRFAQYLSQSPRPDGVFAASDELAEGFIAAATSHNLHAGRDFHIVGFDGQQKPDAVADKDALRISTVRVPAAEMGRRAAQLMIARHADPSRSTQRLLLTCSMWHGNTAARPTEHSS